MTKPISPVRSKLRPAGAPTTCPCTLAESFANIIMYLCMMEWEQHVGSLCGYFNFKKHTICRECCF